MGTDQGTIEHLRAAYDLLKSGKAGQAKSLLLPLIQAQPHLAEVQRLLAFAHLGLGEKAQAERAFMAAAHLAPKDPSLMAGVGELAWNDRRLSDAEAAWRHSLAIDSSHGPAAIGLARLLNAERRFAETLALTAPATHALPADARLLDAHATALKMLGRHQEALEIRQKIMELERPGAGAGQNLAAAFLDLARYDEAVTAANAAVARGADSPELHYIRARGLQGIHRFAEAKDAYREALERRKAYPEAARDLAHLIWMQTGDLDDALAPLTNASPANGIARARIIEAAGDPQRAYAELASLRQSHAEREDVHLAAAQLAITIDPALALQHVLAARTAVSAPSPQLIMAHAAVCLAMGEPQQAVDMLEPLHQQSPDDQSIIAFLSTAWRLLGDARYNALYNYEALVAGWMIDTPPGWSHLSAYLADLAEELHALHALNAHPVGQSLRHGTMAERNLLTCETSALRSFPQAVDAPIRKHLDWLAAGEDLVRSRRRPDYQLSGLWTVRLRPGGFHVNHVHPMGWLSSACHIEVPATVGADHHDGWLQFGQPGIPTKPDLPAEHFVHPEPGRLVLFPSYMWHGTVPFSADATRLTLAFDIVPRGN